MLLLFIEVLIKVLLLKKGIIIVNEGFIYIRNIYHLLLLLLLIENLIIFDFDLLDLGVRIILL